MNATVLSKNVMVNIATVSCILMNYVSLGSAVCNALSSRISFSPRNSKSILPVAVSAKISNASKCIAAVIGKEKNVILNFVNVKVVKIIPMVYLTGKRKNFSFKSVNSTLCPKDKIYTFIHSIRTKKQSIPQVTPL